MIAGAVKSKAWRSRRVMRGECIDCHAPAAPERSRCKHHLERQRLAFLARRS